MSNECVYCTLEEHIVEELSIMKDGTIRESFLFHFILQNNPDLSISYQDFEAALSIMQEEGRIVINEEECDEPEITLVDSSGTA